MNNIFRTRVTGVVLAGGRGSRMGGVDKGLQDFGGVSLVEHAVRRLAPQVQAVMVSANRHLDQYAVLGVPVWPDAVEGYAGPLAGMLTGLEHATTDWLVSVPCDCPAFPQDLVERLVATAVGHQADVAVAATRDDVRLRRQPVFCLVRTACAPSLRAFLATGERKVGLWLASQRTADVVFEDASAFANANTMDELRRLRGGCDGAPASAERRA
jgi:molybdopterin-guanine dinucleotide biosynthesis protein A